MSIVFVSLRDVMDEPERSRVRMYGVAHHFERGRRPG